MLDAAVASNLGGERGALTVLRGDGRGGFKPPRHFDVGDDPHAVAADCSNFFAPNALFSTEALTATL